jgi:hypothetical protein
MQPEPSSLACPAVLKPESQPVMKIYLFWRWLATCLWWYQHRKQYRPTRAARLSHWTGIYLSFTLGKKEHLESSIREWVCVLVFGPVLWCLHFSVICFTLQLVNLVIVTFTKMIHVT